MSPLSLLVSLRSQSEQTSGSGSREHKTTFRFCQARVVFAALTLDVLVGSSGGVSVLLRGHAASPHGAAGDEFDFKATICSMIKKAAQASLADGHTKG